MDSRKEGKTEKKLQQAVPRKVEAVIYLGPKIKGIVNTGTVFNNGPPDNLGQAVKEMPEIGELLIPLSQVVEARKKLSLSGSSLRIFYEKAKSYRKEN